MLVPPQQQHATTPMAGLHRSPSVMEFAQVSSFVMSTGKALHKWLLDLMPQPVFVRSATGSLLYCNQAGAQSVGMPRGEWPESWQVTPQVAPQPHAAGVTAETEGELDLLREPVDQRSSPPLPSPCNHFFVLLQDGTGVTRTVLSTHRIPFWLAASDGSGTKRAAVLYVGSG